MSLLYEENTRIFKRIRGACCFFLFSYHLSISRRREAAVCGKSISVLVFERRKRKNLQKIMKKVIVTGAGGFIGSHFVRFLKKKGYYVLGIDLKYPEFSDSSTDVFTIADLRDPQQSVRSIMTSDELYMFAADMGGVGYIESVPSKIMHDNVLINTNSLDAAVKEGIPKVFFASSACVYPKAKQQKTEGVQLKESDALPADPDSMYGWEKLFSEHLCLSYATDHDVDIRIARFHNIYGPEGVFEGGREKSPAALCRKIAIANDGDAIEIWGDGKQTRSYCYIDDCCEGIYKLMQSSFGHQLNIGSSETVTIDHLVDTIASIAGKKINKRYMHLLPQGVRGRSSDNTLIRKVLNWEPTTIIADGMKGTYRWIEKEIRRRSSRPFDHLNQ